MFNRIFLYAETKTVIRIINLIFVRKPFNIKHNHYEKQPGQVRPYLAYGRFYKLALTDCETIFEVNLFVSKGA